MAPYPNNPPKAVLDVYKSYPKPAREKLLALRKLIFSTAANLPEVGEIDECLKWSEPAYLTKRAKTGSTIRIAWKAKSPDQIAMYLNCNTSLVDTFRSVLPELTYAGNRAIELSLEEPLPLDALGKCVEMALTYHLQKVPKAKLAKS